MEKKKYNWRTHEWKIGDRGILKASSYPGLHKGIARRLLNPEFIEVELNSTGVLYQAHRSTFIPLRKKEPKLWTYFDCPSAGSVSVQMVQGDRVEDGKCPECRTVLLLKEVRRVRRNA